MTRSNAFIVVLSLFFLSILFRLPNLNRLVSKHHEFMTALILINIESWRQAGGGDKFNYVPVLNFQNPGDKYFGRNIYTDRKGNQWYLSLGPGWYIIPYFIYQIFHLPAEPIYLHIINLFFNLFSIVLFFYFLEKMLTPEKENKYHIVIAGCLLFMFTPGVLWYFGNGYAHTGIMMPFVIAILILTMPMLTSSKNINFTKLSWLSLMIVLLIYFDWLGVFICFITALFALWKMKYDKRYAWLLLTLFFASVTGIMLLFLQFSSYGGTDAVIAYWKARFFIRAVANQNTPFLIMAGYLIIHMLTMYLPLIILIAGAWLWLHFKKKTVTFSKKEIVFLKLYASSLFLYNLILLEWSYEHEFSVLPWSVLLAYFGIRLLTPFFTTKNIYLPTAFFLIATITQYYFINRPGTISIDGMPYNSFETFGSQLKQVPPDYKIFSPLETNAPMIEYYAGRNITILPSYKETIKYMQERNITKAVWVDQDHYQLKRIIVIR